MNDNLFSRNRTRNQLILTIDFNWLKFKYPEFECEEAVLRVLDDGGKSYHLEPLTKDDFRIMHKYICLCEDSCTDHWKVLHFTSLFLKKRFKLSLGGLSKELEPKEYDRILKLSEFIRIVEKDGSIGLDWERGGPDWGDLNITV